MSKSTEASVEAEQIRENPAPSSARHSRRGREPPLRSHLRTNELLLFRRRPAPREAQSPNQKLKRLSIALNQQSATLTPGVGDVLF